MTTTTPINISNPSTSITPCAVIRGGPGGAASMATTTTEMTTTTTTTTTTTATIVPVTTTTTMGTAAAATTTTTTASAAVAVPAVVRPPPPAATEAQLRWSQFHQSSRAAAVHEALHRLWQTPTAVEQVPGAVPGVDDASSTSSSSSSVYVSSSFDCSINTTQPITPPQQEQQRLHKSIRRKQQVKRKPVISKGRRALLRVSQRTYQQRKADIAMYGYYGRTAASTSLTAAVGDDDDARSSIVGGGGWGAASPQRQQLDGGLAALFAEECAGTLKKQRQRRRRNRYWRQQQQQQHSGGGEGATALQAEEERVRRFEQALYSIWMMTHQQQDIHTTTNATATPAVQKRWSRPPGTVPRTADGREYADLKWGILVPAPRRQRPKPTGGRILFAQEHSHQTQQQPHQQPDDPNNKSSDRTSDDPDLIQQQWSQQLYQDEGGNGGGSFHGIEHGRFDDTISNQDHRRSGRHHLEDQDEKKEQENQPNYLTTVLSSSSSSAANFGHFVHVQLEAVTKRYLAALEKQQQMQQQPEQQRNLPGKLSSRIMHLMQDPTMDRHDQDDLQLLDDPTKHQQNVDDDDWMRAMSMTISMDPVTVGWVRQVVHDLEQTMLHQQQHAPQQSDLIWIDGQFHKPAFCQWLQPYLQSILGLSSSSSPAELTARRQSLSPSFLATTTTPTKPWQALRSPLALAQARRAAGRISFLGGRQQPTGQDHVGKNPVASFAATTPGNEYTPATADQVTSSHPQVMILAQRWAELLASAVEQQQQMQSSVGRLDTTHWEQLLSQTWSHVILQQANEPQLDETLSNDNTNGSNQRNVPNVAAMYLQHLAERSHSYELNSDDTTTLPNAIAPERDNNNQDADLLPDDDSSKVNKTNNSNNKWSGFLSMLKQHHATPPNQQTGSDRDGGNSELDAVAAFRRTQDGRRRQSLLQQQQQQQQQRGTKKEDDHSSLSSFRVLPDGIKKVVQSFRTAHRHLEVQDIKDHPPPAVAHHDVRHRVEDQEQIMRPYPVISFADSSFSLEEEGAGDEEVENSTGSRLDNRNYQIRAFSADGVRRLHQQMLMKSAQHADHGTIIDTDGTEVSFPAMTAEQQLRRQQQQHMILSSLMLSPTILTKRHQQALRAVEHRNWEQVAYLLSANPWLAEMTDINTNQYLLHKLAFFGAGQADIDATTGVCLAVHHPPSPQAINLDLVRMFPSCVHKFDVNGNLPLHLAAASGNTTMIRLLGERFPSGASVRNEEGMLPLHLALLWACSAPSAVPEPRTGNGEGGVFQPVEMIQSLLSLFPGAIAVVDNEGNLPIHTAASVMKGDLAVDVIYLLLDEAERLTQQESGGSSGARFRNRYNSISATKSVGDVDNLSIQTETTLSPTDSSHHHQNSSDDALNCNLFFNEHGHTPLAMAIKSHAGFQVIEALVCGPSGGEAALSNMRMHFDRRGDDPNEDNNDDDDDDDNGFNGGNNALHWLVQPPYLDPAAALVILKNAPQTASIRNDQGMLPIEIACRQALPTDIILALALVDLPIPVHSDQQPRQQHMESREGMGASWWFLTCECDDHYIDVVEEVLSLCTYAQARSLCMVKNSAEETLLSRATPKSRMALERALRFVGRYEFVKNADVMNTDVDAGVTIFEALDFGPVEEPYDDGRRVILKCFATEEAFIRETGLIQEFENDLDFSMLEDIFMFSAGEALGPSPPPGAIPNHFVSIHQPNLTLAGVEQGMRDNEYCQKDIEVRKRYASKVFAVLRLISRGLRHLHSLGLVHGNLSQESCGKYDDNNWKIADILNVQRIDELFDVARFSTSFPPEALYQQFGESSAVTFLEDLPCHPSIDSWAFGKMAFEVLVGVPLVPTTEPDGDESFDHDQQILLDVLHWNEHNLDDVHSRLLHVGVPQSGADLIVHCLAPESDNRPTMDDILSSPVWKERRRLSPS